MKITLQHLNTWYQDHLPWILDNYISLLKIPSISTDPGYKDSIQEAAEFVMDQLKSMHFKVEKWETAKHPVIFASYEVGPSKPTLLIYHHYDVQPTDPLEEWKSPPFEPLLKDNAIYARGASDNKGQLMYTLTALKAYQELSSFGLNIKLFIEGEEECGSVGSRLILKSKQQELQSDYLLIVDTLIPSLDTPAITIGLRGLLTMEVICSNSTVDLHSGALGGIALNPNQALVTLLAKCFDAQGKVIIPGFYEGIAKLSAEEERGMFKEVDTAYLTKQFGLQAFQGDTSEMLWEKNTLLPTFEINGISGGYTGAGFKTVIPSKASAKISCRLVPHQNPEKIFALIQEFLTQHAPKGITLTLHYDSGAPAVRSSSNTPLALVCAKSYTEVFEKPCQKILSGASIPLVTDLTACCNAEVVMMGMILDSDQMHAPNEHFGLEQLRKGFLTMATILGNLSEC
ncbi:MAG: M20/M25/M40 family metallo-hydrolase [Candidatus Rhabdochlamydia sp.]